MTSSATPRPPLPRWVWIIAGVLVAGLIVAGAVWWAASRPTASPTPSGAPSATSTPKAGPDVVTGCLAEGQSIQMLLTTQKDAAHTKAGAVEFATAAMRWGNQWPWPTIDDYRQWEQKAWAGGGSVDQAQYDAQVSGPNASGGVIPEGTPFHLTAAAGRWFVDSYAGNKAQVTVGLAYTIGDAVSPVYRAVGTFDLVWAGDGWMAQRLEKKHSVAELFDDGLGTPYTGGC